LEEEGLQQLERVQVVQLETLHIQAHHTEQRLALWPERVEVGVSFEELNQHSQWILD
jgi:hypothetical protein